MKLYYKNKTLCTESNYLLLVDASDEKKYDVKWRGLFLRYLQVMDSDKNELAQIRREKGLMPHYGVYINEEKIFDLKKEFHPLLPKHSIEGRGWQIQDKAMLHDYDVLENGAPALSVSQCYRDWGRSYEIQIADGVNELYAVCVALTIDVCMNGDNFMRPGKDT